MLLVSRSVSDMLILTTQEILTKASPQKDMYLHYPKHRSSVALLSKLLSHCLIWRPSIWSWQRLWRRQFDFKGFLTTWELVRTYNCDSMSAIYLVKNQGYHARTKHIDVRYHFIREIIDEVDIELKKIHKKENLANMFTKIVSGVKFAHCKKLLNILPVVWAQWSSFVA